MTQVTNGGGIMPPFKDTLSEQQIVYAATDAWACRQLYLRFKELGVDDAERKPAAR